MNSCTRYKSVGFLFSIRTIAVVNSSYLEKSTKIINAVSERGF